MDIRSACNLEEDDSSFDKQLIPLINSQIMMAHQFGVGSDGFFISSDDEIWADWLGSNGEYLRAAKTWLGYSVMLMFDPPDNGTVLKAYQDMLAKMEWMLREKTEEKGFVKDYVPEKADFYDDPKEESEDEPDDGGDYEPDDGEYEPEEDYGDYEPDEDED